MAVPGVGDRPVRTAVVCDICGGESMDVSENRKILWSLIQGELGCRSCVHFEGNRESAPCPRYYELEEELDCPHWRSAKARPNPVE